MENQKGIGKGELVALLLSSCIGTGIFGITSDLSAAAAPGPAILAWLFVGAGTLMLVLSLNNLSAKRPDLKAGIFSYAGAGFGPLGEFISGWSYWLSAWLGNIAFATMLMSSIGTFFPTFKGGQNLPSIIVAIIFCWALTFLVNAGVETASFINMIGTICKLLPLLMFIIIIAVSFKAGMFTSDFWGRVANNASKGTTTGGVWKQMQGALMTLIWVFIGVEGISVMTHRAKSRAEANSAAIIGFVLLVIVYMLISILPYGVLTRAQMAGMGQPAIGHVLEMVVGHWGSVLINVGLIISTIVSWLSWTMLPAETTMLLAEDHAMSPVWGKLNSKKAPTASLMITAVLQTIFLFSLLFTQKAYEFAYGLCASAILYSYLLVGLYQMKYSREHHETGQFIIGFISAVFEFACMILAGWQSVLLVTISFIPGFCLYVYACKVDNHKITTAEKVVMGILVILGIAAIVMVANGTIKIS